MFTGMPKSEVFHAKGRPVLSGAFGVEKVKHGKVLQRFIADIGINEYCARFSDGALSLAPPTQLSLVCLDDGERLIFDEDDESNCFYNYSVPPGWVRCFAFDRPVDASIFGGPKGELWHPALRVVPMGWVNSCDILQDLAKNIVVNRAGFSPQSEITPEKIFPDLRRGGWLNYIDNLFHFRVVPSSDPGGDPSPEMVTVRQEKEKLGIPLDVSKRKNGVGEGNVLGAFLDGNRGVLGVSREKRQLTGLLCLKEAVGGRLSADRLLRPLGYLAYAFQFARSLFSVLFWVYRFCGPAEPRYDRAVVDELLISVVLLPLAQGDLRSPISAELSATDASPYGGAGGSTPLSAEQSRHLLGRTEFRGSAVRLDDKEVLGRKFYPNAPYDCNKHDWSTKHAYPWKHSQHINILEAHALLLWIRKRARSLHNHGRRFFHVLDSAVTIGAYAKGRSSSWRLNRVLRRAGAVLLASSQRVMLIWTSTDLMPMDRASRLSQPRGKPPG
jgi:hypothetical protein